MKDNEIISLFELRDEHAIEALSDKYHPYCYKIAWNLLTNKEDSEECLVFGLVADPAEEAFCIITFLWQDHEKFKH